MKKFFISLLAMLGSLIFLGCFVLFGIVLFVLVYFGRDLPDYHQLEKYEPLVTSRLYANNGQLLAEYASERRIFVPVSAIPERVIQAFLSAEDKNFYSHSGIDYTGIVRAIVVNAKNYGSGRNLVGASTITQQVAKNFLLSSEQSYKRKIKEALLARRIEQTFEKDHILELYLNQIFLGFRSYGVAAASLAYFNKSMDELELHEVALLAGLPKGPSSYNPTRNYKGAFERRNYVLERMYVNGYITETEMKEAKEKPIVLAEHIENETVRNAEFYSEEVRRMIERAYGDEALYHGGLSIRTSLDPELQEIAVKVLMDGLLNYDQRHGYRGVIKHLPNLDNWEEEAKAVVTPSYYPSNWEVAVVSQVTADNVKVMLLGEREGIIPLANLLWARHALPGGEIGPEVKHPSEILKIGDLIYTQERKKEADTTIYRLRQYPEVEGAVVALDPHTGRVLAMVGGSSFQKSQFNRAVQAYRQPGSSFKPFVYMTALDSGFTPSSLILDAPLVLDQGPGQPKWKPRNYTKIFYGPSTLRTGIEKSRNLMTVRLAQAVGIEKTVEYAKKFGVCDDLLPVLSMSLGSGETTLMRMTAAYAMIVNGGKKISPNLIDRVQNRTGKNVYKHDMRPCENCQAPFANKKHVPEFPDLREQVEDPITAYQMVNIMTGVVLRGTGAIAQTVKRTLAGKSGTSNDNFDTWFIGFSPDLVVGVWVGFDNPQTLGPKDTGGVVAAPIFRDFMKLALKDKPDTPFRIPEGVRLVRVNYKTGLPVKPGDKEVIIEAFRMTDDLSKQTSIIIEEISQKNDETPDMGGLY